VSSGSGDNVSPSYQAAQLRSAANILALLLRHRDDVGLQNLFDNLWMSGQRVRSRITPGGLAKTPDGTPERVTRGDRWANEIPALFCSHLASLPVWPADEICELLERNVSMFREEFAAIDPDQYQVDTRDKRGGLTDGRNWTVFPFFDGLGNLQVQNARKCPRIADFLRGLPGVGGIGCMAFFSIMNPKTHVRRHTSQLNTRLRYHLGIEVPEHGIRFRVHDQKLAWTQDRCIKIDDSYEHEVFQRSDRRRVIFVLDLPHPDLLPEELEFLESIMQCSMDSSALRQVFEKASRYGVSTIEPTV
jgi:hypothetical protein